MVNVRLLPAVISPELPTGEEGWQTSCWPISMQINLHIRPSDDTVTM